MELADGTTWVPPCVRFAGGIGDEPCWCGACEPPPEEEAAALAEVARRTPVNLTWTGAS